MISLFQGAGFDRWEQVLHRLELTVYRSRNYRCIYCIEPATVRPLRTLLCSSKSLSCKAWSNMHGLSPYVGPHREQVGRCNHYDVPVLSWSRLTSFDSWPPRFCYRLTVYSQRRIFDCIAQVILVGWVGHTYSYYIIQSYASLMMSLELWEYRLACTHALIKCL